MEPRQQSDAQPGALPPTRSSLPRHWRGIPPVGAGRWSQAFAIPRGLTRIGLLCLDTGRSSRHRGRRTEQTDRPGPIGDLGNESLGRFDVVGHRVQRLEKALRRPEEDFGQDALGQRIETQVALIPPLRHGAGSPGFEARNLNA